MRRFGLLSMMFLLLIAGCDEREEQLRSWQQRQVEQLQQQAQKNAEAAQHLVTADAESRRQFVTLEQGVQAERNQLAEQALALHRDRQELTAARERLPLLATAFQGGAVLLLAILALAYCGRLLHGLAADDGGPELEETLILTIAGESDLLAEPALALPAPPGSASTNACLPQPPDTLQSDPVSQGD